MTSFDFDRITSITIGERTVSSIVMNEEVIYPKRRTLIFNFLWVDGDNADGYRPSYEYVTVNATQGSSTALYKEIMVSASNNWTATDSAPYHHTYSVVAPTVNHYTSSVSQTDDTFDITFTHPVDTRTVNITFVNNAGITGNLNIGLNRDGTAYTSKSISVADGGSFTDLQKNHLVSGEVQQYNYTPTVPSSQSYIYSISGSMANGYVITLNSPVTGTLNLQVLVTIEDSDYPSDIESSNLFFNIYDDNNTLIDTVFYRDMTGSPRAYSITVPVGDYYVQSFNYSGAIRDCVLDGSSTINASATVSEDDTSNANLWLFYHPSE